MIIVALTGSESELEPKSDQILIMVLVLVMVILFFTLFECLQVEGVAAIRNVKLSEANSFSILELYKGCVLDCLEIALLYYYWNT